MGAKGRRLGVPGWGTVPGLCPPSLMATSNSWSTAVRRVPGRASSVPRGLQVPWMQGGAGHKGPFSGHLLQRGHCRQQCCQPPGMPKSQLEPQLTHLPCSSLLKCQGEKAAAGWPGCSQPPAAHAGGPDVGSVAPSFSKAQIQTGLGDTSRQIKEPSRLPQGERGW